MRGPSRLAAVGWGAVGWDGGVGWGGGGGAGGVVVSRVRAHRYLPPFCANNIDVHSFWVLF